MKQFGFYTIKRKYLTDFGGVASSLYNMKITKRPFLCVKNNGQNWLIPIASIDPAKQDYKKKKARYINLQSSDRRQSIIDRNKNRRAIIIVKDIFEKPERQGFHNVIEFYNAIPVKSKYCNKYKDSKGNHFVLNDSKHQMSLKQIFIENIRALIGGYFIGFIKEKTNQGIGIYSGYAINSLGIYKEIFKDYIALQSRRAEECQRREKKTQKRNKKDELRAKARAFINSQNSNNSVATDTENKQKQANNTDMKARARKCAENIIAMQNKGEIKQPDATRIKDNSDNVKQKE